MLSETKDLLLRNAITRVVIVDDAYDEPLPAPYDIDDAQWTRFFTDMSEEDEAVVRQSVGAERYDTTDDSHLRQDPDFVAAVWALRSRLAIAGDLFVAFERELERKRADLIPLHGTLKELGVTPDLLGRDDSPKLAEAQIIFLDLFLGREDDPRAVDAAIARVKRLVTLRRDNPPAVILMSASHELDALAPTVRDDAELLGCQFRTMHKRRLRDSAAVAEQIYDLVVAKPDAEKLNAFILAWETALTIARREFLRTIRTLDLADYANLHALVLEAEGEPVGDYVIDLYDVHLHSLLESDSALLRAARTLNDLTSAGEAPGQFRPTQELDRMADGAMFHHEVRTQIETENVPCTAVKIGDVFLGPAWAGARGRETNDAGRTDGEERPAFVVLTAACDLQHGELDRVLLLEGIARPYTWKLQEKPKDSKSSAVQRTPIMAVGNRQYTVDWSLLKPQTWTLGEIARHVEQEGYVRVRRFRTNFALQLQQSFTGRLGRVGTPVMPPARFSAGVRISVRTRRDEALLLVEELSTAVEGSVVLVGRTERGGMREWLLLSDSARTRLRTALLDIPENELTGDVVRVRDDPAFYRRLQRGLAYGRNAKGQRPLGAPHDVLLVYAAPQIVAGEKLTVGPLVIELDLD